MSQLLIVFLALCVSLVSATSLADTGSEGARPDVRIVIDVSGSMKDTDPQNLRRPALNLLTELLPDGAQAGVWTFGRYVNMLVPLGPVDDDWRQRARNAADEIASVGLNTNLVGALDRSLYQATTDSDYEQTVILLTDGRIDMDASQGDPSSPTNRNERSRLFTEVLPKFTGQNVRIHTLALSEAADSAVLQQLSMETDGLALKAHTADELMPAFLKAFDRAVPAEQVPLVGNTFSIDSSVDEFTALIFRASSGQETRLIAPSGRAITMADSGDVRWHNDLNFDLITVSGPEAGEWQVDADIAPDSRVQILSDLTLMVEGLPGSLFSGVPVELDIALKNEGEVVIEPTILQLTDVTLQVTAPDGRTGSKLLSDPENLPVDGLFKETLSRLTMPGEYQLEINAQGRTFQRRRVLTATLAEPLQVSVEENIEQQLVNVRVTSESDMVDTSLSRVISRVATPEGSSVIHSMTFNEDSQAWELALRADKGPGEYEVMLNIRGVSASGATFKSKPETIKVVFPLGAAPEPVRQPEPITEPEPDLQPEPSIEPASEEKTPPQEVIPPLVPPPVEQALPEPDLASRYSEPEAVEGDGGIPWWVFVILAVATFGLLGGVSWWLLKRRKPATVSDAEATSPLANDPDLAGDGDLGDLGDFDDFDGGGEEDIPMDAASADISGAMDDLDAMDEGASEPEPVPAETKEPDGIGSDTDMGADDAAGDEFNLDDATDAGSDEDWGEFDLPEDDSNKP
ncbi:MAG: VWA domain-containing protein [Pseudomonadota bacterium]|nr:VWA domain-containing protein [Pseudomonadota bacterium]